MNMETNKIFAAVLVAGIIACFAGFGARLLVHPHELEQNAYEIEAVDTASTGQESAAPAGPEPIGDILAAADVEQGAKISKICAACHTFDKGGAHRVGPNLYGVAGRARASVAGYPYSDALKAAGGAWDVEALNAYLWNPKKAIPGNKMVFAGLKKPEDRAAMIKWLQSQK